MLTHLRQYLVTSLIHPLRLIESPQSQHFDTHLVSILDGGIDMVVDVLDVVGAG